MHDCSRSDVDDRAALDFRFLPCRFTVITTRLHIGYASVSVYILRCPSFRDVTFPPVHRPTTTPPISHVFAAPRVGSSTFPVWISLSQSRVGLKASGTFTHCPLSIRLPTRVFI